MQYVTTTVFIPLYCYIEDVHHLFYAHFRDILSISLGVLSLDIFFCSNCLDGVSGLCYV